MNRPHQRQNIDRRENTAEGHDVKWELSMNNMSLLKTWHFVKNYRTFCGTTPSAWKLEMWLPEIREDGTASLTLTLERVDSDFVQLEACVWVDICDRSDNLIFPKQTFSKTGMSPGDKIRETVEMTSLPNMRAAIHRSSVVFVTLMICFCHSDSDSSKS